MIIRVDDIPETGLDLEIEEEGAQFDRLAKGLDFSITSPVRGRLNITASDTNVNVTGEVDARLALGCSRCLKDFEYGLKAPISVLFLREKETEREKELTSSEMDVNYLEGDSLDTNEVLLAQIALELPIKPLCREDCKGLCTRCGSDLNKGPCGCKTEEREERTDQRFEKLKDFKVK